MNVTDVSFYGFLILALAVYYVLPGRGQKLALLAASLGFMLWMGGLASLAVLCGQIVLVWGAALLLQRYPGHKAFAAVPIVFIVSVLAVGKYGRLVLGALWPALGQAAAPLLGRLGSVLGLSYFSLMAAGYLADVAGGRYAACKSLADTALFLAFFPQVTCGPIGRGDELLPQLAQHTAFDYDDFTQGLTLLLLGLVKKLVIADGFGLVVDGIFAAPQNYAGPVLLLGAAAFTGQLYFDFAGYSQIACGVARLFGIRLRENFNHPFRAVNFSGFWSRWHMSLSAWFRQYVYIPLGGNRKGPARQLLNIFLVFYISGIWHGSTAPFLLWGLLQALYRVGEQLLQLCFGRPDEKTMPLRRVLLGRFTVLFCWGFSMVVFRVGTGANPTLAACLQYYLGILSGWGILLQPGALLQQLAAVSIGRKLVGYMAAAAAFNAFVEHKAEKIGQPPERWVRSRALLPRTAVYYAALLLILFFGQLGKSSFIYFQF